MRRGEKTSVSNRYRYLTALNPGLPGPESALSTSNRSALGRGRRSNSRRVHSSTSAMSPVSIKFGLAPKCCDGRVEDGRGGLGPMANTPFPVPAQKQTLRTAGRRWQTGNSRKRLLLRLLLFRHRSPLHIRIVPTPSSPQIGSPTVCSPTRPHCGTLHRNRLRHGLHRPDVFSCRRID